MENPAKLSPDLDELIDDTTQKGLQPFTRKETKAEGIALVALSFLTLLLSRHLIRIDESSFLGFKIAASGGSKGIQQILFLANLYYFVIYVFDVYADWKGKSKFASERLNKRLTSEIERQGAEFDQVYQQIAEKIKIRSERSQPMLDLIKSNTLANESSGQTAEETLSAKMARFRINIRHEENIHALFKQNEMDDQRDGLDNLMAALNKKREDNQETQKMVKVWIDNRNLIYKILGQRFAIEVLFPLSFGLISLLLALRDLI
jgi:hypothetical protein